MMPQSWRSNGTVRQKELWGQKENPWNHHDLTELQYGSHCADGSDANVRLEDKENRRACILVLMNFTADANKAWIAVVDRCREIEPTERKLLLGQKKQCLKDTL